MRDEEAERRWREALRELDEHFEESRRTRARLQAESDAAKRDFQNALQRLRELAQGRLA